MRLHFLVLPVLLILNAVLHAQHRLLLRFTSQTKEPGQRNAYIMRSGYKGKDETVILPGEKNSHYAMRFSSALVRKMSITEEGLIALDWEPFTSENQLLISVTHTTPWASSYTHTLLMKHLSPADYLDLPFMSRESDTLDLSYGYNLQYQKLITPTSSWEGILYRNLTCLYNESCEPFFKQIQIPPADAPVRIDSSVFFKRMTAINLEMQSKADSVMKHHFGNAVFEKYFQRACFQKTCEYGYPQDNFGYLNFAPCDPLPDTSCKNADILYRYVNGSRKVNLEMRVHVYLRNQPQVWLTDGGPPSRPFTVEDMDLLSLEEIESILKKRYPKDSLRSLAGSLRTGSLPKQDVIFLPGIPVRLTNPDPGPGFPQSEFLEEISDFGKKWTGGYVYEFYLATKQKAKPNGSTLWYIDAVTGQFLYAVFRLSNVQESMPRVQ